jgi:hypothetical protein
MTKFPDAGKPAALNAELMAVIQAVCDAVAGRGYVARLASDTPYHNILWDNVELYLLGCKRGVAIVEDKYLPELNPNVAMEWGWDARHGAQRAISSRERLQEQTGGLGRID